MGTTVQRNVYSPGQNLNNLSINVDDNRVENDQSYITVNFTTSPATVTVLTGSKFEVNGNNYVVTVDEVFQMSNATHNYITFDGTTYGSAATSGIFTPAKQGHYQAGNLIRTLRWYIEQVSEMFYIDNGLLFVGYPFYADPDLSERCAVTLTPTYNVPSPGGGLIPFNVSTYDTFSLFNISTYQYTCAQTGHYDITFIGEVFSDTATTSAIPSIYIEINTSLVYVFDFHIPIAAQNTNIAFTRKPYLTAGDTIQIRILPFGSANLTVAQNKIRTELLISRAY
jgi:hypothetical protein